MDRIFSTKSDASGHNRKESGKFYFVPRDPGVTQSVRDTGEEGDEIEVPPPEVPKDEATFEPKPVNRTMSLVLEGPDGTKSVRLTGSTRLEDVDINAPPPEPPLPKLNLLSRTIFAIFGSGNKPPKNFNEEGAKKVNPKIFLSLERTFLAWMKVGIFLSGMSIALGSGSKYSSVEALYSVFFLGVAIAFIIYSLVIYAKRSLMIVRRAPGPYEEKWGPVVLGSLFVFSLTAQYCIFMAAFVRAK